MSEPTEDRCAFCDFRDAPLAVEILMQARYAMIDTIIYPTCVMCYLQIMENEKLSIAARVVKDPLPRTRVKTWSKRDYALSW